MKRQKNNNRVIKIVVPVIICLVAALVVAGYFLFRVNNISYEGNRHYSDEEMNNYIFGTDTPNAVVYNIFGKKNKQIPFIQKYEVETIWPDKMNVTIYEKAVVGYINYMGCNMYFDKDGIVVESSSKLYSGVPQIEGLNLHQSFWEASLMLEMTVYFRIYLNLRRHLKSTILI